jgi:hypothetical protein
MPQSDFNAPRAGLLEGSEVSIANDGDKVNYRTTSQATSKQKSVLPANPQQATDSRRALSRPADDTTNNIANSGDKVNDKTASQATIKQATPDTPPDDFYGKLVHNKEEQLKLRNDDNYRKDALNGQSRNRTGSIATPRWRAAGF